MASTGTLAGVWLWNTLMIELESSAGTLAAFFAIVVSSFWIYAVAATVSIGVVSILARQRVVGLATLVIATCGAVPFAWSLVRPIGAPTEGDFTLLSANLCFGSADLIQLKSDVDRHDADVIVLQEVNDAIVPRLRDLFATSYPHSVIHARPDAFGEAVFCKYPLEEVPPSANKVGHASIVDELPRIDVVISTHQGPVRIVDVHTLPPISGSYVRGQDRMARALAAIANETTTPIVFAGDFNSSEMGVPVRRLLRAGLESVHTARSRGLGDTWPRTGNFRNLLRTRIDQILFSRDLTCTATGVGSDNGSDHRPVWATFQQTPQ